MANSKLRVVCAMGGSAAQRTAYAQAEAEVAAARGRSVLVLCASRAAAHAMRRGVSRGVRVSTPLLMAEDLLRHDRAQRVRVLGAVDERVLFEDMRVTQVRQNRLKGILRYLERSFANMDDDDDAWLKTGEERLVCETLEEALRFSGGVLASQAAGRAVRLLRSDKDVARCASYDVVVACDYHLMSRASQQLACCLATDCLVVATAQESEYAAEDAYPNCAGARELFQTFSQVEVMCVGESDEERAPDVGAELFSDAAEELSGIADMADRICDADADAGVGEGSDARSDASSGEHLAEMLVISNSATWRGACSRMLRSRGIAVRLDDDAHDVPDDLRYPSNDAERAVLARLREDSGDSLAWRTWCALGDYLGCSVAIRRLREAIRSSSLDLTQALALLSHDELVGVRSDDPVFSKVMGRYREGLALLSHDDVSVDAGLDEKAVVLVCSPRAAHGCRAKTVVVGACVEGVLPHEREERESILARAREVADERVVCTSFSRCSESAAASMGVEVTRIGLCKGVKACKTNPLLPF